MTRFRLRRHLLARATAWLLILICAWMGTEGVLHHTDAGSPSRAASSVHRVTLAAAADACAACQWTQGMQSGTPSVCHIQSPLFALIPRAAPAFCCFPQSVSRSYSSRAPPVSLTLG